MKQLKPRPRIAPAQALAAVAQTAPHLPPAQLSPRGGTAAVNMRLRQETIAALAAMARERGLTLKQVVCSALAEAGVAVAPADLEDRTPRRGAPR